MHIVGVYDGTQAVVYLNGELKDAHQITGTVNTVQVIQLTSPEGCDAVVTTTLTVQPSGMAPLARERFAIYPNPADGIFILQTGGKTTGKLHLEIFNGNGQRIYHKVITAPGKHPLDLSASPEGIYLVRVSDGTGSWRKQVVIL